MALSYVTYAGVTGTGPFSFGSILLLDTDMVPLGTQLKVYKNGALLTEGSDFTFGVSDLTLSVALVASDNLRIARTTKDDGRYVNYENGSRLTEGTLDLDSDQVFFLVQEAKDATVDALTKGVDGNWDAQSLRIRSGLPGEDPSDFITLDQAYSILYGGDAAVIDDADVYRMTGNGSTAWLQVNTTGSQAQRFLVTVDSILQSPDRTWPAADTAGVYKVSSPGDGDYPGGANGTTDVILFETAPANGAEVVVRSLKGTVITTVDDGTITTPKLANDSVTIDKLGFPAGDNDRFIVVDSQGNPSLAQISLDDVTGAASWIGLNIGLEDLTANANVSLNTKRLTNLANPSNGSDGTNKTYVDTRDEATLNAARSYADSQVAPKIQTRSLTKSSLLTPVTGTAPFNTVSVMVTAWKAPAFAGDDAAYSFLAAVNGTYNVTGPAGDLDVIVSGLGTQNVTIACQFTGVINMVMFGA